MIMKIVLQIIFFVIGTLGFMHIGAETFTMTETNIRNLIEQHKPVIIRIYAEWSGSCTSTKDNYKTLSNKWGNKYLFTQFNIDMEEKLAEHFGVKDVPTYVFIKNQTIVDRLTGALPEEELKRAIQFYLGH